MADEERQEAKDSQDAEIPKDDPKTGEDHDAEAHQKGMKSSEGKRHDHEDCSDDRKPSRAKSDSSDGRAKQREFFKEELKRLEESLKKQSSKIVPPPRKKNTPFIFNSLAPYYDTHTTRFLVDLPEGHHLGHTSRSTAQGLCDPWVDLRMDKEVLPPIQTRATYHESKKHSKHHGDKHNEDKRNEDSKEDRKEDAKRQPLFPIVAFETNDLATRQLYFSDVPMLRRELRTKYSSHAQQKVDADYKRTHDDFHRLDLDKIDRVPPSSRQHLASAYLAYLQNTPGSSRAVKECVRGLGIEEKAN